MKIWAVLLFSMILAGCATTPVAPRPEGLFNDHWFPAPSERISADDVFAFSSEMQRFLNAEIADQVRTKGGKQGLFDALYSKGLLKLDYDSALTRNAAQAFDARSGNCLSLVIMTAAFAKKMGLSVQYQSAVADETWSRSGGIYFFIGHVNLTLGKHQSYFGFGRDASDLMTIDFLPPQQLRGLHTRVIGEETIVAMYMNNRAAEAFTRGQLNDAYWWAREAIGQDPRFLSAYNTLGVVYWRHGDLAAAERVLASVLEREPANTRAMSNLASVLNDQGRVAEARILNRKLEQMDPNPPFSFFNAGLKAMRDGDYRSARDLFTKEVDRAEYYHEFHFWLALAYVGLGEIEKARKHMAIAIDNSPTRTEHDLYAAKLDRIRTYRPQ
jgi:Flp pilus assembly protein TadD